MTNKFRNYTDSENQDIVEKTYKNMLENQTEEFVIKMKQKYSKVLFQSNIWKCLDELEKVVDESDPDTNLPQIVHLYQTAESIKYKYLDENMNIKGYKIKNLFSSKEWELLPEKYKIEYQGTLKNLYKNIITGTVSTNGYI